MTQTRKRALFITQTHNVWGGMEQWLDGLTRWLQSRTGWDVRVGVARGIKDNDPQRYLRAHPHLDARILDVRVGTESVRQSVIVRAIEQIEPAVVIPLLSGSAFPAIATAKGRGSKARFLFPIYQLSGGSFVNAADYLGVIDGLVFCNRLFFNYWRQRVPEEQERLHYVRNGVRPAQRTAPAVAGGRTLQCAYVGRVEQPAKRILDLVPFANELARLGTPVALHVFGDGPERAELEARLAGAAVSVAFHGYKTRAELYSDVWPSLDVTVLFSQTEGATPFTLCEAMAHGVVPVTSRFPGLVAEGVVRDRHSGLVFPIGDVARAAACVDELARDRALRERLSSGAKAAMEGATEERMHEEFAQVMERTLELPQKRGVVRAAPLAPAGRLDRWVGADRADRLRAMLRRYHPHEASRAEWPADAPFDEDEAATVTAELLRLDAADVAAMRS